VDTALDTTGATITSVVISGVLVDWSLSGLKYVLQDVQSSTRVVMSGNQIVARHDYLPFGEEISAGTGLRTTAKRYAAPERIRQQYAGLERDDVTGLDHSWWRQYENRAERWTSTDPLAGSIGNPQSLNRYAYVQNDPVNFVDPSGLDKTYPGPCPLGGCIVTVLIPRDNNPISNLPPGMMGSLTGGIRRIPPISEFEPRRVGGGPQKPSTTDQLRIQRDYWKQFGKALYGCLESVFKGDATAAKKWLDSHGLPAVDFSNTTAELAVLQSKDELLATRGLPSPYEGPSGTIYVAAQYAPPNKPMSWAFETITHETGNIMGFFLAGQSWQRSEQKYGDPNGISDKPGKKPGEGDKDAGAKLEKCVHGSVNF
jgi:RHS repeat-associated protein